jgi:hypothetical protein
MLNVDDVISDLRALVYQVTTTRAYQVLDRSGSFSSCDERILRGAEERVDEILKDLTLKYWSKEDE